MLPEPEQLARDLKRELEAAEESAAPATIAALSAHLRLLAAWNARYHLTSLTAWDEILDRHLRESLLPLRWLGDAGTLVDIGSGNGFPVVPILACRPAIRGTLIERSANKALFLEEALRSAGLVHHEVLAIDLAPRTVKRFTGTFDFVMSRATLAPVEYLALATVMVKPGGRIVLFASQPEAEAALASLPRPLTPLVKEPIAGRRDSYLYVLER